MAKVIITLEDREDDGDWEMCLHSRIEFVPPLAENHTLTQAQMVGCLLMELLQKGDET